MLLFIDCTVEYHAIIIVFLQGVKCPTADQMVAKSLDNIVGNLWQQRQESSGSSVGNQVLKMDSNPWDTFARVD